MGTFGMFILGVILGWFVTYLYFTDRFKCEVEVTVDTVDTEEDKKEEEVKHPVNQIAENPHTEPKATKPKTSTTRKKENSCKCTTDKKTKSTTTKKTTPKSKEK